MHLKLTLKASSMDTVRWWIDAAYGVHKDKKAVEPTWLNSGGALEGSLGADAHCHEILLVVFKSSWGMMGGMGWLWLGLLMEKSER